MRILLVEDEPGLCAALSALLTKQNYTVDTAMDGVSALSKALTGIYDGIILDIQKLGTEEYMPDDTLTLIFTGVAMQRNVTFAKNDTARVIYGDNNLIEGWKIALPFIKKNSSGILLVTYNKGYGKERVGVVEPYSTLKFTFTAQ